MNTQNTIHPYNGVSFGHRKRDKVLTQAMDETLKQTMLSERYKGHTLCVSIDGKFYRKCPEGKAAEPGLGGGRKGEWLSVGRGFFGEC